jgi:hypothetical protein
MDCSFSRTFPQKKGISSLKTLARCVWTVALTVAATVAIGGISLSTAHAVAIEIYGNLGSVSTSTTSNKVGLISQSQPNQFQAQGFSVGPQVGDSAWGIESIDVGLASDSSPLPVMQIYSDVSGAPGSALATFTTSSVVSTKQVYSFTGSFVALQNTSYWVVLSDRSAGDQDSYEWYLEDGFTTLPSARNASGISYLGTKESSNGGPWTGTLGGLSIAVYGSPTGPAPVPEIDPASFGSVLALVTGTLGLLERRRLKVKAA